MRIRITNVCSDFLDAPEATVSPSSDESEIISLDAGLNACQHCDRGMVFQKHLRLPMPMGTLRAQVASFVQNLILLITRHLI